MLIRLFGARFGAVRVSLLFLLCLSVASPNVLPCDNCGVLGQCSLDRLESDSECCQLNRVDAASPHAASQQCQMAGGHSNCACCSRPDDTGADLQSLKMRDASEIDDSVPLPVRVSSSIKNRGGRLVENGVSIHIPTTVLLR
jgi:hypothetical protein